MIHDRRTPCPRRAASDVHWHELDREPAVGRVHAACCIVQPRTRRTSAMALWAAGRIVRAGLWAAGMGRVPGASAWRRDRHSVSQSPSRSGASRARSLALLSTLIADVDSTMHNARRQAPDLMQHAAQCARAGRTATRNATDSASARLPHDHTQHTATTPDTRTAPPRLLPTTTDRSTLSSLPRPHTRFLDLLVLSPPPDSLFRLSVVTSHSPNPDPDPRPRPRPPSSQAGQTPLSSLFTS